MAVAYNQKATEVGKLLSYDEIEKLRSLRKRSNIIAQAGSQEKYLSTSADILIGGGSRGGAKSYSMLMDALYDVRNPKFYALIMRNEKNDLTDLINTSYQLYQDFGSYNRAVNDMTWNFTAGGKLAFAHYSGTFEDFQTRFRGRQYSYIAVDEVTQISFQKFKFLITCNRNAAGIRNRFIGMCNPDPDSWVRKFISWWIGEDGLPIPERDGVLRYCFMDGDTPDSIYWGDTPEEVYEQCKSIIDPLWRPEYEELGFDKVRMFVKSVTFIYGRLEQNLALIESDPNYVANLAQQSEEHRARDLGGNWNYKRSGTEMIKLEDMERFFTNPYCIGNNTPYVSADIAFEGGDFCVMWLWHGLHIKDLFVMTGNSADIETRFKNKLAEWGVREENVVYDFWGVGQALAGHVKRAVKFTGTAKPREPWDKSYRNIKSQCAEILVKKLRDGEISIDHSLLSMKFFGKKYQGLTLSQILMRERKCVRNKPDSTFGGFELIDKRQMIQLVGFSPDFFESLIYRMYFEINKVNVQPRGIASYVPNENGHRQGMRLGRVHRIRFT